MNISPQQKDIPSDWQRVKLGDIGRVSMCKRIFKNETFSSGQIPFYKISTFGKIPDAFISEETFEKYKDKYPYPKVGEILISASGTIGRTVVFDGEKSYFQDSNIVWISNPEDKVSNKFLNHTYSLFKWRSTDGGIISRLYNDDLRSIRFLLPPLPEQSRIVVVLETWDKSIEKLSKKIEIKKAIKKGLMQELLTGKTRLPGYEGKWQIVELGEVCEINPKNGKLPDTFVYIDLESVEQGRLLQENVINAVGAPSRAQRILRPNDIIFQIVRPYQRNNLLFNMEGDYVASTGYAQIRANDSPEYLYYLLHTDFFVNRVMDRCTGSNYPAVNSNDLLEIDIPFPQSKEEQTAIAKIITTIDQQITILEHKLSLLKDQKKYLLNNLITGAIRTPEKMKITKLQC